MWPRIEPWAFRANDGAPQRHTAMRTAVKLHHMDSTSVHVLPLRMAFPCMIALLSRPKDNVKRRLKNGETEIAGRHC